MSTEGGDLRSQLESSLAENKELKESYASMAAEMAASEHDLVSPDDLKGVAPDEMAAKAAELQQAKVEDQRNTVSKALEAKGLSGDDLEKAVDDLLNPEADSGLDVVARARQMGVGGATVPAQDPSSMSPLEKLEAGVETASHRARRKR